MGIGCLPTLPTPGLHQRCQTAPVCLCTSAQCTCVPNCAHFTSGTPYLVWFTYQQKKVDWGTWLTKPYTIILLLQFCCTNHIIQHHTNMYQIISLCCTEHETALSGTSTAIAQLRLYVSKEPQAGHSVPEYPLEKLISDIAA